MFLGDYKELRRQKKKNGSTRTQRLRSRMRGVTFSAYILRAILIVLAVTTAVVPGKETVVVLAALQQQQQQQRQCAASSSYSACSTPDSRNYYHLIVLVHGYMGSDREQSYLGEALVEQSKRLLKMSSSESHNHEFVPLYSKANVHDTTDGIAAVSTSYLLLPL